MMAVLAIAMIVGIILLVKRKELFATPHMVVGDCAGNATLMGYSPVNMYYEGILNQVSGNSPLPQSHSDDTDCLNYWSNAYYNAYIQAEEQDDPYAPSVY